MKRVRWLVFLCSVLFCVLAQNATVKAEDSNLTTTWNGHTYMLVEDGMSWMDAVEACKNQGGYLATITSEEEQNVVEALVLTGEKNGYWLGGYVDGIELHWVTDEEPTYTKWAPGQPYDSTENYVMMYRIVNPYGEDNLPGFWNDLENEGDAGEAFWLSNMGYVCEWGSVSEDNQSKDDQSKDDKNKADQKIAVSLYNIKGADDITFSYGATFDKEYFDDENSEIVAWKGLLKLSALGAMSTYASKPDVDELSKAEKKKILNETNTLAFLKQCGFRDRLKKFSGNGKSNGKSSKKDNDHGTIYCGWQELDEDTRLFAFVISGYSSGGYEWISNFNLGAGTVHTGFDKASDEMTKLAAEYINKYCDGKNVKIWLMGHSRGAALTDLVSIKLVYNHGLDNNKALFSSKCSIDSSDIFAYGFATPQYTTLDIAGFEDSIPSQCL